MSFGRGKTQARTLSYLPDAVRASAHPFVSCGGRLKSFRPVNIADVMLPPSRILEVMAIHKRIFNAIDANKDGKVTLEELEAFTRD